MVLFGIEIGQGRDSKLHFKANVITGLVLELRLRSVLPLWDIS